MVYTMKKAREDFLRGLLFGARVVVVLDDEGVPCGWNVLFYTNIRGEQSSFLVDAREFSPRCFKTLDAAVAAIRQVGLSVFGMSVEHHLVPVSVFPGV